MGPELEREAERNGKYNGRGERIRTSDLFVPNEAR